MEASTCLNKGMNDYFTIMKKLLLILMLSNVTSTIENVLAFLTDNEMK